MADEVANGIDSDMHAVQADVGAAVVQSLVETTLIKALVGFMRGVYFVSGVILVAAVGGAVWVTRVDSTLTAVKIELIGIRADLDGAPPQWVKDALARNEHELERQQVSIDRNEARLDGVPYDNRGYTGDTRR
jgi:hypothetical protein